MSPVVHDPCRALRGRSCATQEPHEIFVEKFFLLLIRCLSVDREPHSRIVSRTMTIRFQCGSCSQPIEVDDEWSSKPVACPYCRKTVTAPMESTLGDPAQFQAATPIAANAVEVGAGLLQPEAVPVRQQRNVIAIVALCLAVLSLGLLFAVRLVLAGHVTELEGLERATSSVASAERTKIYMEFMEANPDAMGWMVLMGMLILGWLASNLAAIICAIIAIRRPVRRGIAMAALAIGFVPILFFLGSA